MAGKGDNTETAGAVPPPAYEYPANAPPQMTPGYGYGQYGPPGTQVIVTQPGSILVAPEDPDLRQLRETNQGFMIFSIFVLFCCNLLFGSIGACLGWMAKDALYSGEKERGRCLSRAGCAVSAIGIPVSIIILVVYFTVIHNSYSTYNYNYSG